MRFVALLGVLLGALAATAAADPLPGAPLDGVRCDSCHLITTGTDGVPKGRAQLLMEAQEMLCAECHQGAITSGHPSGIVPERPLPPEYPLDFAGFLTCSSCHVIHQPSHGGLRAGVNVTESCLGCHQY